MKKSFTLFSVIILVFIFSLVIVKIFETKSINSINIVNQYKYIEAKNHLLFLEEYLLSLDDLSDIDKIQVENNKYNIIAFISSEEDFYELELSVKLIDENIRVHKIFYVDR